jgi:hypothetical protein
MEAKLSSGASGSPGGSAGFSRKPFTLPLASASMTPNSVASLRGTRSPAMVTPALVCRCWSIICDGSIR